MRLLLNGAIVETDEPPPPDEGGGLFETMRGVGGRVPFLERHLERLSRASERLGMPMSRDRATLREDVSRLLAGSSMETSRVRLCLRAGNQRNEPLVWAQASSYESPQGPLSVGILRGHPGRAGSGLKTLAHEPFRELGAQALAAGWDEALLLDEDEQLIEGTRTNVFIVTPSGRILTPPLVSGPLPGVARAWVLEALQRWGTPVTEAPLHLADLGAASEVLLCNALMGVRSVLRIEGAKGPCSAAIAMAQRLDAAFRRQMYG